MKSMFRDIYFWLSIFLLALTDIFFVGTFLDWFDFGLVVGQYRLHHWFSWAGFLFVLFYVALFVILKRRFPTKIKYFLGIHVLGNLTSYLLISIHFASQLSRPAQFYPDLGTGLVLYIFMITLVATGFLQRFNILRTYRKNWRFLHMSSVVALIVIIFVHILHGIGII